MMRQKKSTQYKPKDREDAEFKLLTAAQEIFSEKGFEGATTRMIAERAGINLGLISRYFGNKKGLLLAVFNDMCEEYGEAPPYPEQKSLSDEINMYIEMSFDTFIQQDSFYRIAMVQAITDPSFSALLRQSPVITHLEAKGNKHITLRFCNHLKKDIQKDKKNIENFIATLDRLVLGVFTAHYIILGDSKKKCLQMIKESSEFIHYK